MPNGIHEVNVDAYSGQTLEDSIESPADEEKEKPRRIKTDLVCGVAPLARNGFDRWVSSG
jgi:hypothetical protein